jgi:hypothetical protein
LPARQSAEAECHIQFRKPSGDVRHGRGGGSAFGHGARSIALMDGRDRHVELLLSLLLAKQAAPLESKVTT